MMQQPVCHVCEESVRPSRVCSSCNRPYHRQCGLVVSDAVPPGWTEPEYKAHARREKCWSCATLELQQRAGSKITLYTPGTSLGLLAKLTLRGVESFFKYLGLEEQNQPEDYRRDREEAVFKLYKMIPLLGGVSKTLKVLDVPRSATREPMTVFVPAAPALDPNGCVTVLLMFHGGAFVMGSHDTPFVLQLLASIAKQTGIICVSANYRKAPENKFPTWNNDASTALAYCLDELPYHEDFPCVAGLKVVVSGDSAGGNIACSAAHQHRRHISAALLFYPILNLATFDTESWLALGHPDKHLLLNRPMALAQMPNLFHDYEHALLASASPVFETDWEDVPPVHVLAAGFDPLLDDSKQYVQKCREAGLEASLTVYSTSAHGWLNMPHNSEDKKEAVEEIVAVLTKWATLQTHPATSKILIGPKHQL